ncbi:hypothetical protein BGZ82_007670 [Podila clonocystis]|nr:hypothetical protein BGZ82_007670 [Podila clonocystis]
MELAAASKGAAHLKADQQKIGPEKNLPTMTLDEQKSQSSTTAATCCREATIAETTRTSLKEPPCPQLCEGYFCIDQAVQAAYSAPATRDSWAITEELSTKNADATFMTKDATAVTKRGWHIAQ